MQDIHTRLASDLSRSLYSFTLATESDQTSSVGYQRLSPNPVSFRDDFLSHKYRSILDAPNSGDTVCPFALFAVLTFPSHCSLLDASVAWMVQCFTVSLFLFMLRHIQKYFSLLCFSLPTSLFFFLLGCL